MLAIFLGAKADAERIDNNARLSAPKIPLYWFFYRFGFPKLLPFSIVVSVVVSVANSKCRTCDVWRKPNDDLTLDEWTRVFQHIGNPIYLTFTGGRAIPSQRFAGDVIAAYQHCHPEYITIPTNGILTQRIRKASKKFVRIAEIAHWHQSFANALVWSMTTFVSFLGTG